MRLVVVTVGAEPPVSGKSQRDTNLVDTPIVPTTYYFLWLKNPVTRKNGSGEVKSPVC